MTKIPLDDPETGNSSLLAIRRGFQMESDGITNLVKELAPTHFEDMIPTVALYRPGPLGSGMVTDFIKRSHGETKVTYLHPLLEPILKDTYGVILYQEQVMQIASAMGGFSLGQADLLRRAMGKKRSLSWWHSEKISWLERVRMVLMMLLPTRCLISCCTLQVMGLINPIQLPMRILPGRRHI